MIELEKKEIELLRGKGFEIHTVLCGQKKVWKTKKMTLGRLIALSELFLQMKVSEASANSNDLRDALAEQYISVHDNARIAAKVMAIAVSDTKWERWFLARHFLKNISSSELIEFAQKLIKQADYQNFLLSIVLMNANRVTKASPIEETA